MAPTHSAIDTEKRQIRAQILRQRRSVSNDEIQERSREIEEKLVSLAEFQSAERIMFYVSMPGEVDTHKMIQDCLNQGKKVVVPVTNKLDNNLFLCEIDQFPVGLKQSTYGVLEPELGDFCHLSHKEIDLIIVPGVAFDRTGHRLGHGGGYYDRFLKTLKMEIPKIALAFDFQILESLPKGIWDVPVDLIVVESEVIKAGSIT